MAVLLEEKKIHCEPWLASVIITGSAQVLEKYQMESLSSLQSQAWTSSILQELPQPCLHLLVETHRQRMGAHPS